MGKIRAMSLFYKSIDNQLNKINEEHMTHNQVVAGSSPAGVQGSVGPSLPLVPFPLFHSIDTKILTK